MLVNIFRLTPTKSEVIAFTANYCVNDHDDCGARWEVGLLTLLNLTVIMIVMIVIVTIGAIVVIVIQGGRVASPGCGFPALL